MILAFMIFVWLLAALSSDIKSYIKAFGGHAATWAIAIGVAGWIVGALVQIARYGAVTTPAFQ